MVSRLIRSHIIAALSLPQIGKITHSHTHSHIYRQSHSQTLHARVHVESKLCGENIDDDDDAGCSQPEPTARDECFVNL